MEDPTMLENTHSQFITVSYADQSLDSHGEQISNECTNIILDSGSCQNISDMTPLNGLLLGQTFIIETNEQPLFVNGSQLITFQQIDSNEQINNIQTISTIESEKPTNSNIDFSMSSDDDIQNIYTNFNKTNSDDIAKKIYASNNLKEHLDILNDTDMDITRGNYSNSVAIKILDDVAKSPTDTNGHFVCDLCLHEFYKWQNYKKHKLEHLNDKPFKCLNCLKSFNYNNNYLLHIASHSTNNLKCPQCKKEFKRVASFKSHLKIHKTEESITCNICYKIFDNQYRLDIHKEHCMQENIISLDNPLGLTSIPSLKTCKTCKKSLPTVLEYKMHIKEHKKFNSALKKQYKYTTKLKKSCKTSNLNKRFKCDQLNCDWSFNRSNLLLRHMRTHTGEKPFKCLNCSRLFTQQNSLNRHLLKHKGLRPFSCEFCEMTFFQKGHLINHMKRCHAVTKETTRIHKCSMCSCTYISLNALNKHLNAYHGLKSKKSNKNVQKHVSKRVEVDDINDTINLIKDSNLEKWLEEVANELQSSDNNTELKHCNPISTQCEFELNLIENEHYDHIDNNISSISNMKSSSRMEIENLTNSLQNDEHIVSEHIEEHDKQSLIKYDDLVKNQEKELVINGDENELIPLSEQEINNKSCSSKKPHFDKISKLDAKTTVSKKTSGHTLHLTNSSISQPAMKNTNCKSSKAEPKVLFVPNITTSADANVALKPQPKVCQFCGKIFKKNADLERHERTHTGDKPYKCDNQDCDKAFATKYSLEYHTLTHLGKMKRAVCPQCNGLFATTSSMKVHMRQHTGEKPFKCPVCGDAFRTSGHLHTHVIIHERKNKRK